MSATFKKYLLIALALLLTGNLFFNIASCLGLSFIIIAVQLLCLRKEDSTFIFLLLGSVFGAFYAQNGVRFVGSVLIWGAALILFIDLIKHKRNWYTNYYPLLFFIFIIILSILSSRGGSYSSEKFISMMMNVIPYTIAFSHLILFREKHSFGHIGLMFVLFSIFLLGFMNEQMGAKADLNSILFSFAGFRVDINEYLGGDKEIFHVSYQSIGMYGCMGLIYTLFSTEKESKQFRTLAFILSLFVVWYAAARQALLLFAIIVLSYFVLYKGLSVKNVFILSIIFLGGLILLQNLDADSFNFLMGSTEGKDSARDRIIHDAMNQFYQNPVLGVGFGRFYHMGEYGCNEHNLFVELLTELGITGCLVFILFCAKPLLTSYNYVKHHIQTFAPFLLILFSYFLRSMVSSDLRETIVILILALCIQMGSKYKIGTI